MHSPPGRSRWSAGLETLIVLRASCPHRSGTNGTYTSVSGEAQKLQIGTELPMC